MINNNPEVLNLNQLLLQAKQFIVESLEFCLFLGTHGLGQAGRQDRVDPLYGYSLISAGRSSSMPHKTDKVPILG